MANSSLRSTQGIDEALGWLIGGLIFILIWPYRHQFRLVWPYLAALSVLIIVISLLVFMVIIKRKQHKLTLHQLNPDTWNAISGIEFEDQIVLWLRSCGYKKVVKTDYYDLGLDIIASKPGVVLGVQVKRSSNLVGVSAIRAAVTALRSYGCSQAMVVTNSSYTIAAQRLAQANDCQLIAGDDIKSSLIRLR